jgi:hypothetical protein
MGFSRHFRWTHFCTACLGHICRRLLLCLPHWQLCLTRSLETARLMASALGGLDSAEAGAAGVAAALPPQYVDFKEQIRL